MKTHLLHYRISLASRLFNMSRSGYYAWLNEPSKASALTGYIIGIIKLA